MERHDGAADVGVTVDMGHSYAGKGKREQETQVSQGAWHIEHYDRSVRYNRHVNWYLHEQSLTDSIVIHPTSTVLDIGASALIISLEMFTRRLHTS